MRDAVHVTIFSTSLNARSRSFRLAEAARESLDARGVATTTVDLRETVLPAAGPDEAYDHPNVLAAREAAARASHVLIAAPVYNYQLASPAKNLVELVGRTGLGGKTVGFLCSAGGRGSFMAPMSFANSLMLDFRCWIVPRFVYAVPADFDDDGERIVNPDVARRVEALLDTLFERG